MRFSHILFTLSIAVATVSAGPVNRRVAGAMLQNGTESSKRDIEDGVENWTRCAIVTYTSFNGKF
jgi:hypothetical protein